MGDDGASGGHPSGWVRQYPPLLSLVISLLIAFLVLPSSLNLPQSNPSTVLEFAPVPPEDDDPPPPQDGSLSSLGLGSSSSLSTDSAEDITTDINDPSRGAKKGADTRSRTDKRCVGSPPRQTEDPNAPPCVGFFDGDNFGSTWQGVTKDEITLLIYVSQSLRTNGHQSPNTGYCDVAKAADTEVGCRDRTTGVDHTEVKVARAMAQYFNDRFQTYGRFAHFHIYWTPSTATSSTRRADAQENWDRIKPFAVVDRAFFGGFNSSYSEAMVKRRVSVYGNFSSLANKYFKRNAPYIWSFWPDVEHSVDQYVSYVCTKVAPHPVQFAGDLKQEPDMNGKARRYAYLWSRDPQYEGLRFFADLAKERFKSPCPGNGVTIADSVVADVSFPRHQFQTDTHPDAVRAGRDNVAKMRDAGVTTILWLQGYETEHTKAAFESNPKWFPEWFVAGDLLNDGIDNSREQQQQVWEHAVVVSNTLREEKEADTPCRQAFREVSPTGSDLEESDACSVYRAFFMLFRGIQVAGPRLSPTSVDQGNHAIPRQSSSDPFVAACFYDPGDYSCVKDAQESWWDPNAPDPDGDVNQRGCWRLVRGGLRFLAGDWPPGPSESFRPGVPCNNVDTQTFINPYGPQG